MKANNFFAMMLFIIFFLSIKISYSQGELFPIGTGWVKNPSGSEREDMYWQAAECGINIINGNVESGERQAVLDSAEKYGIRIIADHVAYNIDYYRGFYKHIEPRIHHQTFESTGYNSDPSNPRLQQIEERIIYDFDHEVGTIIYPDPYAEPDYNDERNSLRVDAPGTPGYLICNIDGNSWTESGRNYYTTFRLKIDGDIAAHDSVADIAVVRKSDNHTLDQRTIYSDDFSDVGNLTYKEFQLYYNTNSSKEPQFEDSLSASLPTDDEKKIYIEKLDFRVYWHGEVTVWLDNITVMDSSGKTLFSGTKDNDIINETQLLHAADSDHNTLIGFYQDEPYIFEIEPIHYISNLMYDGAPSDNKNVVMQPCTDSDYTYNQYLNMGSPETYQSRYLLGNIYPIRGWPPDAPEPGESGYNDYIQDIWETDLIPLLDDARYVANLNNVPFWYWAQATSYWSLYRSPLPKEIRAMVSLGLTYGAKGIWYFLYTSIDEDSCVGLVSTDFIQNDKWYEVQAINNDLQLMTPDILHLNWESAFTSGDSVPDGSSVVNINGADYIEIGNFQHESIGDKYFILVNRMTENSQTQTMTVQLESSDQTRLIEDVIASRQPWDGNPNRVAYRVLNSGENTFIITLQPGEGRLFRISLGLSGTISMKSYWSGELMIADNVTVNNSISLTIYPGTTVKFDSGKKITVNGTLDAQGTADNHIVFTKTSSELWGGIWFNPGSNDNSTIKHCTIEYSTSFGIFLDNSSPTIEWTKIRNCNFSGIQLMGLSCPELYSVELTNNGYFGAIVCEGACFEPYYTLIDGNGYSDEIDVFGGIYNIGESYIRYSQISNNTGIGIFIDEDSWADLGQDADDEMGYNNIGNNSSYEISSFSSETIPAVWNFWGDSDGPDPDDLNGDIEYEPFFDDDPGELPWDLGKKTAISYLTPDMQLYRKGIKLMRNGEYSSAGKEFQNMVSQYPSSYFAKFAVQRWVHTRYKSKLDNEILPYLDKLKKTNIPEPLKDHVYKILVHAHRKQGNSRSALSLVNSSMRNRNRKKFMKYQKGFILLCDLKDTVNAITAFQSYVHDYPKDIRTKIIQSQLNSLNSRYLIKPGAFENIPNEYKLYQAYPNPFNHQTTFQFDIPELSRINIAIYNILGRQIISQNDSYQPGRYSFTWNRTSSKGNLVSSGVYFIILSTEKYHASQKILFLK